MPDSVGSARLLSGCWLVAALGCTTWQMTLLAIAWHALPSATLVACVASAWIIGSVCGTALQHAMRRVRWPLAPLWGGLLLACVSLWAVTVAPVPLATSLVTISLLPRLPLLLLLAAIAVVLGVTSTLWLAQRRPWPEVSEPWTLARGLLATTCGLVLAWLLPTWSLAIGVALALPLLALDLLPCAWCPLPLRVMNQAVATTLETRRDSTGMPARFLPLRLAWRTGGPLTAWRRLAQQQQTGWSVLTGVVTVCLGAIWAAIPTPFAAERTAMHSAQATLLSLLAGQVVAVFLGLLMASRLRMRGMLGPLERLIPTRLSRSVQIVLLLALSGLAAGLVLLALPWLQAPGWLALSLGCYTLAGCAWAVLLPRLRAGTDTQARVLTLRHHIAWAGRPLPTALLAYEQALDRQTWFWLSLCEGALMACLTPLIGVLIDQRGVDGFLLLAGIALACWSGVWLVSCCVLFPSRKEPVV